VYFLPQLSSHTSVEVALSSWRVQGTKRTTSGIQGRPRISCVPILALICPAGARGTFVV
jgi:hypothetical protein